MHKHGIPYSYSRLFTDSFLLEIAKQEINKGKKDKSVLPQTFPVVSNIKQVFVLSASICTGIHAVVAAAQLAKLFLKKKEETPDNK